MTLEVGKTPVVVVNDETLDPSVFTFAGLRAQPGALPALLLEVDGEGTLEGDGVAVVMQAPDEVGFMRQFLAALDPEELERRTMAHQITLSDTMGPAVVKALLEMIS